ncbi:unnamed protein product [Nezara viridula]|uniref:Pyrroline-5-carboxylate reductase n=1 Tax=Nezara viridula TaxID=85310 RepID=A0A9P0MPR6_NEZVI|nr:unnamed protein product [Nezara viridula]
MFSGVIGFVGAGNMAQAIAFGLIDAGAIPAKNIIASAPSMNNLEKFKEKSAIVTHDNNEVINKSDIIFIAVKPQYLDSAIKSFNNIPHEKKVYVSILAGVRLETIQEKFQLHCDAKNSYKIIRVLPNIAVLVGAGCSVMAANENTPEEDISLVKSLMSVGGSCELIPENLINSCSAVCGSGPAFVSRDINSNLESDNNNKSITFKNVSSHNSTPEPLRVPVDEKSSNPEVLDYCYREKNLSSSDCEVSDRSTVDDSEIESLSENSSNILRKRKAIHENSEKYRFNFSEDQKDYRGYDLHQKISPKYRDDRSYTCNNFQNSEVDTFSGINDSYINENNCYNSRELYSRRKTHFPRYFRVPDDYNWDWETVSNNRHRYPEVTDPDHYVGKIRSVPHHGGRMPSDHTYRSSVHSYNEYYKELDTVMNRKDGAYRCYPFPYWNIGYSYGKTERYSNQSYSLELVGKRKINDMDYIYSQPSVKKTRQNPAFHPLQVVIMRFNQEESISQGMAAKIRLTLILMINATFGSGFSPKFETTNLLQNGHFLVSCSDDSTVDWLLKQCVMEEDGTPFVITKLIDLPSMKVVDTFVSYNRQPVRHVLECLRYQNPSLCINKWLLCKRSVSKSGQLLRFIIDKDSFQYLEILNWKPYFQLCRLQFHKIDIQEEEICVLCKLFSKTCSLCTFQT